MTNLQKSALKSMRKTAYLPYFCTPKQHIYLFDLNAGFNDILKRFETSENFKRLESLIAQKEEIKLNGLVGSGLSFLAAALYQQRKQHTVVVVNDKEEAAHLLNDLEKIKGERHVLFYPASYRRPYEVTTLDNANVLLRAEVLNRLKQKSEPLILVTYTDALLEKVVTRQEIQKNTLSLKSGMKMSLDFLNEVLFEYEFQRVDFVTEAGEFSVRGGIVDVFSFSKEHPYRIEFMGDEIESIRLFDIETQTSIRIEEEMNILPNLDHKTDLEERIGFFDFIEDPVLLLLKQADQIETKLDQLYLKAIENFEKIESPIQRQKPNELYLNASSFKSQYQKKKHLQINRFNTADLDFGQIPQPAFNRRFDLLLEHLEEHSEKEYSHYLLCAGDKQKQRFYDIFQELETKVSYNAISENLYQGFLDHDLKISCYTDHQIFQRYHKFKLKGNRAQKQAISLKELTKLAVGDYVTHIDHGIGKFGGLQKIDVEGQKQEAIKLVYGDRDILYVSIHSLHKISKFNGKDGQVPRIYKLGSGAWNKVKQKTKARVKKIAFNLIQVYAKRRLDKGFACNEDSYLQHELEASFLFEDTPDQEKATKEVKQDMENSRPMDRLVCGDVGFGKTEVAIRAAFKAVDNGKQVAVLVPTTVLAFQHANTFKKRLENFPVRIDYLNRFRSAKEKREIIGELGEGKIDILIGTHQLVNDKIKFKDLGLLIVDEEQKFGVSVKEKLKSIKEKVDILTLTATPIPRTLQFSLMAARDLSIINTPPPNRYPIESRVVRFDQELIRDSISYEIQRNGQVFFIHNRIENIKEVAGMIQRLVPDAQIRVGHGQMEGKKLEALMLAFMNNEFDVLVSTTIIESGLDIPNANTILINNANNFGLSDLHQMRGRVGRTNKKAFCYFITPGTESMTADARKRMEALSQYTELGSGFHIAMKDLEIRGAGDLLGGEQSGFINEMGFDTYQKILNEAIEELKENEFSELYQDEEKTNKDFVKEIQIDTDLQLLFPDHYINVVAERLRLYQELNSLKNQEELDAYKDTLVDRFGPLPLEAENLLLTLPLKWMLKALAIERIVLKKDTLLAYFIADHDSEFFQSEAFHHVLKQTTQVNFKCQLKEKQTKNGLRLYLKIDQVSDIQTALSRISALGTTADTATS